MVSMPLVRGFGAGAAFAYRGGRRLSIEQFLWDVSRLAAALPDRQYLLNLCTDRYHFSVGFAAALVRKQVNLLPPNETPDLIGRLAARYPDVTAAMVRAFGSAQVDNADVVRDVTEIMTDIMTRAIHGTEDRAPTAVAHPVAGGAALAAEEAQGGRFRRSNAVVS